MADEPQPKRRVTSEEFPTRLVGGHLDLTNTGHELWMRKHNPEGWDDETLRACIVRCGLQPGYKRRCQEARIDGKPRPHPNEGGWKTPTGNLDLESLVGRMQ